MIVTGVHQAKERIEKHGHPFLERHRPTSGDFPCCTSAKSTNLPEKKMGI
jgi:hypothetical protein